MAQRHVTELLSAALDGALNPTERTRYDEHLADCAECAQAAERFAASVAALRALPRVSMPQRVVLPSTPPQVEPRRRARLVLPTWLPRPALNPAWGAATMVAVGVAAVVLVVHAHGGGGSTTGSTALKQQAPQPQSFSRSGADSAGQGAAAAGPGAAQHSTVGIGTCPLPLAVVPQSSADATPPEGFANRTTATDPKRPGEQLVVATTASKVAPGSQVLIYAALTSTGAQRTAVVPCVTLHNGVAASTTTGGSSSGSSPPEAAAPAAGVLLSPEQVLSFAPYTLLPPLAVASPTSAAVANLPLQVLQIPAGTPHGTRLQLIALVPSGLPGSGDTQAIEAVLTLDVS